MLYSHVNENTPKFTKNTETQIKTIDTGSLSNELKGKRQTRKCLQQMHQRNISFSSTKRRFTKRKTQKIAHGQWATNSQIWKYK